MIIRDYASQGREGSLRKTWDTIKNVDICITGPPEGRDRAGEKKKKLREITLKNSQI